MSSFIIYFFLTIFAIYLSCQIWFLKGIYRHWLILRYISGIGNRDRISKNPCAFHCSIIYLLGGMLRANRSRFSVNKIKVLARYVIEVCPDAYKEEAIKTLDHVTKRSGFGDTVINSDAIRNKQLDKCVYNFCANSGDIYTNEVYGREMAEVLSQYLSEKDRLYLLYLLFTVAAADNGSITDNDKYTLESIYIEGLNLPAQMLTDIIEANNNGRLADWYNRNFGYGDYPAADIIADLYPHTISFAYTKDKNFKEPAPAHKHLKLYLIIENVVTLLIFFAFILKGTVTGVVIFGAIALGSLIKLICSNDNHAYHFNGTLTLPSDITDCRNNLVNLIIGFICNAVLLWILFANIFYTNINRRLYRDIVEKDIQITELRKISHFKGATEYLLYLGENLETIAKNESAAKPQLSAFSRGIAEMMPHLLIFNFFEWEYEDKNFSRLKVDSESYDFAFHHDSYAHVTLTIGYYGYLAHTVYAIKGVKKEEKKN